jgi:hypothetical protein
MIEVFSESLLIASKCTSVIDDNSIVNSSGTPSASAEPIETKKIERLKITRLILMLITAIHHV